MEHMMNTIFSMSITGGALICLVLVLRLALKKAPKIFSYVLWAAVLFRLLSPAGIPVKIPVAQPQPAVHQSADVRENRPLSPDLPLAPTQDREIRQAASKAPSRPVLPILWLSGVAAMLIYGISSYLRFLRSLRDAVHVRGNVFKSETIPTAFVAGILRPKIYLPADLSGDQTRHILAHERCHIRRLDHITRPLAFFALSLHWFNPLVWIAFRLSGRDMELSCDEAVISRTDGRIRADYAQTLLSLATGQHGLSPLAFGEESTKVRIQNMANWKKPKTGISLLCGLLTASVILLSACTPEPVTTAKAPSETASTGESATSPKESAHQEDVSIPDSQLTFSSISQDGCSLLRDGTQVGGIFALPLSPEELSVTDMDDLKWFELLKEPMDGMKAGDYDFMSSSGPATGTVAITFYHPNTGEYTHYVFPWEDRTFDLWISPDSISVRDESALTDFLFPEKPQETIPETSLVEFKNVTDTGAEAWCSGHPCGGIVALDIPNFSDDAATEAALVAMLKDINPDPMEKITKEVPSYAEAEYTTYNQAGVYDHYLFTKDGKVYDLWFNRMAVLLEKKFEAVQRVLES